MAAKLQFDQPMTSAYLRKRQALARWSLGLTCILILGGIGLFGWLAHQPAEFIQAHAGLALGVMAGCAGCMLFLLPLGTGMKSSAYVTQGDPCFWLFKEGTALRSQLDRYLACIANRSIPFTQYEQQLLLAHSPSTGCSCASTGVGFVLAEVFVTALFGFLS